MILEEILAILLSLVSAWTSDSPELRKDSFQDVNVVNRVPTQRNRTNDERVEHDRLGNSSLLEQRDRYHNNGAIDHERFANSLSRCFVQSVLISFKIKIVVLPLALLLMILLYINLNTANLCFQFKNREGSLPFNIKMWNAAGDCVEIMLIQSWFPATLVLLFGWREFKLNYFSTLFICFVLGNTIVIYTIIILILDVYGTNNFYEFFDNILFAFGLLYNSHQVACKIRNSNCSVAFTKKYIMAILSVQFFLGFILAMTYNFGIISWFSHSKNGINKAIIAAITPVAALVPLAACKYFALQSTEFADPGRSFVLLYLLLGLPNILYRIMQNEVEIFYLFIGLSILHGFVGLMARATEKLRYAAWTRFFQWMKKTCCCCTRLDQLPNETTHHRLLKANMEIQAMLFDYTALILSQGYVTLYFLTNFEVSSWEVLKEALIRISAGFGIAFVFNSLSILIQIRWFNIPIPNMLVKQWKLHILANTLAAAMVVLYFTRFILNAIQHNSSDRGIS